MALSDSVLFSSDSCAIMRSALREILCATRTCDPRLLQKALLRAVSSDPPADVPINPRLTSIIVKVNVLHEY